MCEIPFPQHPTSLFYLLLFRWYRFRWVKIISCFRFDLYFPDAIDGEHFFHTLVGHFYLSFDKYLFQSFAYIFIRLIIWFLSSLSFLYILDIRSYWYYWNLPLTSVSVETGNFCLLHFLSWPQYPADGRRSRNLLNNLLTVLLRVSLWILSGNVSLLGMAKGCLVVFFFFLT